MKRIAPFAQLPFALGQEGIRNVALIMVILAQCEKPARRNVRLSEGDSREGAIGVFDGEMRPPRPPTTAVPDAGDGW